MAEKTRERNQTIRCHCCGDPVEVHRLDAKYCSPACRQLAYRLRNRLLKRSYVIDRGFRRN